MAARTPRKKSKRPAVPAVGDRELNAAASAHGLSVLSVRLLCAMGAPGPLADVYLPPAKTLGEVARFFGVSERTTHSWKAAGMPCAAGAYRLGEILQWHRKKHGADATGDLFRAVFRVLRVELPNAAAAAADDFMAATGASANASADEQESLRFAFAVALRKHFGQFRLTDQQIQETLEQCA